MLEDYENLLRAYGFVRRQEFEQGRVLQSYRRDNDILDWIDIARRPSGALYWVHYRYFAGEGLLHLWQHLQTLYQEVVKEE